jgi:hypothetical protein
MLKNKHGFLCVGFELTSSEAQLNHFIFISRTIEADSEPQGLRSTEVEVGAHSCQPMSLLIARNVTVTCHPKQSYPVVTEASEPSA